MLERPLLRSSVCSRVARQSLIPPRHGFTASTRLSRNPLSFTSSVCQTARRKHPVPCPRFFHHCASRRISVIPEVEQGEQKAAAPQETFTEAALSDAEYHELSDEYIENLLGKLEVMAEEKADMDVEFSAGVLNIEFPPAGTYVLNKQPPNKQLWLSSPSSGPKRFNWVVVGDSMLQKEGTAAGDWVYLKDGTRLSALLKDELGVNMDADSSGPH